ncbi:DUF859 family phage minor structural protein [Bacillus licheniformis]|uniref:DUF859 family phage minor structural protein n=1 Tax=Bacillus licheniformis TaxID=1402 RepID=UPI000B8B5168|nr:DUF859 family phage minor structural protein [Bacillus licheniformis]MED0689963.1 DUF859 family phage minor structural protein [Bacillus licheniformis]MED0713579.1 DUF859 family phage minor structural protein [Bacillus licheniformis]MED0789304.1 DUF859 family phage minor structural protein [Bacillus licheniformis]TWM10446.1 hypothetical protein CHCC15091_0943 [Bacillus licheniformis]WIW99387.1 DUF859 family phage minor structural protein [Bacillus licheniformis]
MALSGSARGSGTPRLRIDWSATQSIANNRSTVTAKVYLEADYYINFSATKYGSVTVNGVTRNFSTSSRYSGTGSWLLTTQTFTVNHNSDGTKSFNFSAKYDIKITYSGSWLNTISASGSGTLNTIPRASSISSIVGNTIGSPITVNISRASSSFTHEVIYDLPDGSRRAMWEGVGTSKTFTPSMSDAQYIPNSTSGTAKITLRTFSGNTMIGSVVKHFTIYVPSSVVPTVDTVSISEAVSGLASQFGAYVQNKSKLKLSMTASGAYGSTIRSYKITANGTSYNSSSATTDILKFSGTNRITFEVTDSRGRKASVAREVTVSPYSEPIITSVDAIRANSDGSENNEGTYAKITVNGSISPVENKNAKSFTIYYKKNSASTWSERTISVAGYTVNTTVLIPGFDVDNAYDIRFQVADYFTAISLDVVLTSSFTLINFHPSKKGMAFGEVMGRPEGFDINLDAKFKQAPTIVAPTSTDEDGAFLRLRRLDESLLAFLSTGAGGTGLKLHMYNGASWTGYLSVAENGELSINGRQIAQHGSNSNGEWVRYYDGTQICWHIDVIRGGTSEGYYSSGFSATPSRNWTFPMAFKDDNVATTANERGGAGRTFGGLGAQATGNTSTSYVLYRARSVTNDIYASLLAIGRWY